MLFTFGFVISGIFPVNFKGRVLLSLPQMQPNQSYNFGVGIIIAGGIQRWWMSYFKAPAELAWGYIQEWVVCWEYDHLLV